MGGSRRERVPKGLGDRMSLLGCFLCSVVRILMTRLRRGREIGSGYGREAGLGWLSIPGGLWL